MPQRYTYLTILGLLIFLTCSNLGCGGKKAWHADLHTTKGTMFVNGVPAEYATLYFHSLGDTTVDVRETIPYAIVRADGSFIVSTYAPDDGVPVGEYAVTARWPLDPDKMMSPDRLRGKYLQKTSPVTTVMIQEGDNQLPPIELNGVKLAKVP
ncbi:hypothetical protein DTL21_06535 [Bremerella cremea]|uniref:Carboxypeptidase regulatory-like domain-containing protein n=1 Tax=Blastopirellula marina TaxID=124 RepID=A0A2S8FZH0_9BACT|nr:hypothetical protein C5Y83_06535 [Blastopirellula marina]RCS49984.1 hypothetical protein DTL21_06535 [Bremerella cremea]